MNNEIILASASPRRRELLHQVGLKPRILPSRLEEIITCTEPEEVVKELSRQKAEEVVRELSRQREEEAVGELSRQGAEEAVGELSRQRAEEAAGELSRQGAEEAVGELSRQRVRERCAAGSFPAVVIGADTVVAVEGRILGKPDSKEEAVRMITLLQGRAHQVYTGVTMIFRKDGECLTFAERTDVHVCPMSQEQVIAYVETKEPMDKAGAYGIQGRFAVYIQGIEGDYNNVVGLPLGRVCRELMKRGFQIF